jgi:signal transduction histidine kinase
LELDVTETKRAEEALREAGERLHLLSKRLIEIQESSAVIWRELHDETLTLTTPNSTSEVLARDAEPATRSNGWPEHPRWSNIFSKPCAISPQFAPAVLDDLGLVAALRCCWIGAHHGPP